MLKILFVCTTNTSLSPIAVAICQHLLKGIGLESKIASFCVGTHPGNTPRLYDRRIAQLLVSKGIPFESGLSREMTPKDLENSDYVLVMNEINFWEVKEKAPDAKNIALLLQDSGQLGVREVPDPLLGEIEYEEAFKLMYDGIDKFIARMRKKHGL